MKKILIFVLLPLMLLGGGGAGLFFSGMLGGEEEVAPVVEEKPKKRVREFREIPFFYELADMVLSIRDAENRRRFMIMEISIEVNQEQDVEFIKFNEAKIRDNILVLMSRQDMEVLGDVQKIYTLRDTVEDSIFALFDDTDRILGVDIRNVRIQ